MAPAAATAATIRWRTDMRCSLRRLAGVRPSSGVLKGGPHAPGATARCRRRCPGNGLAARLVQPGRLKPRNCGVVVHFFLGEPDVDFLLGLGQDPRGVHEVGHRHAVRVRVSPAHMREVAPDGSGRGLVGIGRADHLADAGHGLDAFKNDGNHRAALHELGHRVVDIRAEPFFQIEVMPSGQVGIHPDHLGGNNLQEIVLKSCKNAARKTPGHGIGLKQHKGALDSGVVTHDVPLNARHCANFSSRREQARTA
jgi:hypothetical protein